MNKKYFAYISYSHNDEKWAKWLQNRLEKYKFPKSIVGRKGKYGAIPKKLFPIFRDRSDLSSSSNLRHSLIEALHNSRFLIVICSPSAAKSFWVNEEILEFLKQGDTNQILTFIVEGESPDEFLPKHLINYENSYSSQSNALTAPLGGDVRPGKDGRYLSFLKTAAGLAGIDLDMLISRETKRKRLSLVAYFVAILFAVLLVSGVLLYQQEKRNILLSELVVESKTQQAIEELNNGNPLKSLSMLESVFEIGTERKDARYLSNRLRSYQKNEEFLGKVDCVNRDGQFIGTYAGSGLAKFNVSNLQLIEQINPDRSTLSDVVCTDDLNHIYLDGNMYTPFGDWRIPDDLNATSTIHAFSPSGKWFATISTECIARIYDVRNKKNVLNMELSLFDTEKSHRCIFGNILFNDTEDRLALSIQDDNKSNSQGMLISLTDNSLLGATSLEFGKPLYYSDNNYQYAQFFSKENILILTSNNDHRMVFINSDTGEPIFHLNQREPVVSLYLDNQDSILYILSETGKISKVDLDLESPKLHEYSLHLAKFLPKESSGMIKIPESPAIVIFNGDDLVILDMHTKEEIIHRHYQRIMTGGGNISIESLLIGDLKTLIVSGTWEARILDLSWLNYPHNENSLAPNSRDNVATNNDQKTRYKLTISCPVGNNEEIVKTKITDTIDNSFVREYLTTTHWGCDTAKHQISMDPSNEYLLLIENERLFVRRIRDDLLIGGIEMLFYGKGFDFNPSTGRLIVQSSSVGTQYSTGLIESWILNKNKSELILEFEHELHRNAVNDVLFLEGRNSIAIFSDKKGGLVELFSLEKDGSYTPYASYHHTDVSTGLYNAQNDILHTFSRPPNTVKTWDINRNQLLAYSGVNERYLDKRYWDIGVDEREDKAILKGIKNSLINNYQEPYAFK